MNQYKLLTPGPLTTTDTVKAVMQVDHWPWAMWPSRHTPPC